MNLKGKNIVITGASKGIGFELLKSLDKLDCNIVAVSRNIEKLNISKENIYLKNFDLKNQGEIDKLFNYAEDKLGNIDVFIANAGYGYYENIEYSDWGHVKDIFDLNSIGLIYSALKMKDICGNKNYNFVAIGSGLSFMSLPGYALYSSTKASIRGFADAYRYELLKNQYFQTVYPISTTKTSFYMNANCTSPPKPMQNLSKVVDIIIKGIEKNKKEIYPSKGFQFIKNFISIVLKIPIIVENKKLKRVRGDFTIE